MTIAATKALAGGIGDVVASAGINGGYIYKHSKPCSPTYVLHITTLDGVCAFRDWVYRDATVYLARKRAILDSAAPLLGRACVRCSVIFSPRYADKGAYCSRKCYMSDYYAANRDSKWKDNGEWKH